MTLLIDNYDSFSYNLYQLIGQFDKNIKVIRNDEYKSEEFNEIEKLNPNIIIISPGPGKPEDAGICIDIIKYFYIDKDGKSKIKPVIFGVCLGHQAICKSFGAKVSYAKKLMHGKTSIIEISNDSVLFKNMPKQIEVARYHSLSAVRETIPDCLKITSCSMEDNEIMSIEHKEYPIYGVQFHPESVMTKDGFNIMKNLYEETICLKKRF